MCRQQKKWIQNCFEKYCFSCGISKDIFCFRFCMSFYCSFYIYFIPFHLISFYCNLFILVWAMAELSKENLCLQDGLSLFSFCFFLTPLLLLLFFKYLPLQHWFLHCCWELKHSGVCIVWCNGGIQVFLLIKIICRSQRH